MISALERLRVLRAGKSLAPPALKSPEDLPAEWRVEYEERAAIVEYDGGLSRDEADSQALQEIEGRIKNLKNAKK